MTGNTWRAKARLAFFKLLLAACSTAFALVLADAALRLVTGRTYLDTDLRLRTAELAYEPNQHQRWKRLEWDIEVQINSKGFRDYEDSRYSTRPISASAVVLGDSFTEGYGIELEKTYVKRLEQSLWKSGYPYRVYNAGLQGRNPLNYIQVYETFFSRLPKLPLVIMEFCIGDDLVDPPQTAAFTPHFSPRLGFIVPPDRHGFLYPAKLFLCEHSVLYNFLRRRVKFSTNPRILSFLKWQDLHAGLQPDNIDLYYYYRSYLPGAPGFEAKLKYTSELIDGFKRSLEARGKRLLLVIIPVAEQIEDDAWERGLTLGGKAPDDPKAYRFAINDHLARYCRQRHIPLLDLTPALRKANRQRPGSFYFRTDGHWNPAGHALAADEILRVLKKDFLPLRP